MDFIQKLSTGEAEFDDQDEVSQEGRGGVGRGGVGTGGVGRGGEGRGGVIM